MKIGLLLIVLTTFVVTSADNGTLFRGTMTNPLLEEQDLRVLASWNANHLVHFFQFFVKLV